LPGKSAEGRYQKNIIAIAGLGIAGLALAACASTTAKVAAPAAPVSSPPAASATHAVAASTSAKPVAATKPTHTAVKKPSAKAVVYTYAEGWNDANVLLNAGAGPSGQSPVDWCDYEVATTTAETGVSNGTQQPDSPTAWTDGCTTSAAYYANNGHTTPSNQS
jgi:hypothetical protein